MNEKYCVSLETAKRLKELGFPQKSDFYWTDNEAGQWILVSPIDDDKDFIHAFGADLKEDEDGGYIAAPHIGELGEWLPSKINKNSWTWRRLKCFKNKENYWLIKYADGQEIKNETEAEARAEMLIYLAENNLLDPKSLLN